MRRITFLRTIGFGTAALALAAFSPHVSYSSDMGTFAVTGARACSASPLDDGSCGPAPGWVCGFNGINYPDKIYVAPR